MSFPFRSSCSFNDRDATDSFSLLLSWGEFRFWRGRRDVHIFGILILWRASLVTLLFVVNWTILLLESIFFLPFGGLSFRSQ